MGLGVGALPLVVSLASFGYLKAFVVASVGR